MARVGFIPASSALNPSVGGAFPLLEGSEWRAA